MSPTVAIRPAVSPDDLAALVDITGATTPEEPTSIDELRWADRTYPGGARFLGELDGAVVGAATVGRIYVHGPDYPDLWATLGVLPDARRQGVGSALLDAVARTAADRGKTGLQVRCRGDRAWSIAFLERRGFVELERQKAVRLGLTGRPAPSYAAPEGVTLTSLAARPDLVAAVHAVALETFADIPGGDPMAVGDLAEFAARDVDRPGIPADAFMLAVETGTDRVAGYASLQRLPGRPDVAWHDMTAVARAWRGRGLATTLKLATIAWAIEHGLTALETGNDEANAPMRAVNARLGYEPLPDEIVLRGPLIGAMMVR
ncbi:MAG: N-acetyltransferase family protein [Candidatus Limnocylindria bacterium]